ncbi:MAG: hypothetical protein ACMG6E_10645 [Candidatus Roizmanbacteria bacterium]
MDNDQTYPTSDKLSSADSRHQSNPETPKSSSLFHMDSGFQILGSKRNFKKAAIACSLVAIIGMICFVSNQSQVLTNMPSMTAALPDTRYFDDKRNL